MDVTRYHGSNSHRDEQQGHHGMHFTGKNCEHRMPLYRAAPHSRCSNRVTKKVFWEKSMRMYSSSICAVKIRLMYPCCPGLYSALLASLRVWPHFSMTSPIAFSISPLQLKELSSGFRIHLAAPHYACKFYKSWHAGGHRGCRTHPHATAELCSIMPAPSALAGLMTAPLVWPWCRSPIPFRYPEPVSP